MSLDPLLDAPRLAKAVSMAGSTCPEQRAATWLEWIIRAMRCYEITNPLRMAAFLAQAGHESDGLQTLAENLNYSADALLKLWPKRFTKEEAADYARHPERIANRIYARPDLGNGPERSGDGWRYRGGGILQLTGRAAYRECGKEIGLDLEQDPVIVRIPGWPAAMAAAWEWNQKMMNPLADAGRIDAISRRLNGGDNGLEARRARYEIAKQALGA